MSSERHVIVIGGGAAGLLCAWEAAKRGLSVHLLEHNQRLGQKILISGGGRCNFTNVDARPENYLSSNPHFCKSALARYTPADFIALVEKQGIRYHEKKLGQLFCDISSRQIVEMLEAGCRSEGVKISTGIQIGGIRKGGNFSVETNLGGLTSQKVVIATGGLSFAKLGATDFGYRVAWEFGLTVIPPRPGLVPLKVNRNFSALSGVSLDCQVSAPGATFRENILFTHRGVSGPAILQVSNYVEKGAELSIDLLPGLAGLTLFERHQHDPRELHNVLADYLPKRFIQECLEPDLPRRPIARLRRGDLEQAANKLHRWQLRVEGDEGYAKAEVTLGGIDTKELSSKTLESKRVPGLYFIGEVVDVTGWLGGYNFQWAWASAWVCAQAL